MPTYPSIHLFIYSSIHPSIYPPNQLSIHPPTHLPIFPSTHPSLHLSLHPPIHPFIYPPIPPSVHPSIPPSIHLPTYPSIYPSAPPSIQVLDFPLGAGHTRAHKDPQGSLGPLPFVYLFVCLHIFTSFCFLPLKALCKICLTYKPWYPSWCLDLVKHLESQFNYCVESTVVTIVIRGTPWLNNLPLNKEKEHF